MAKDNFREYIKNMNWKTVIIICIFLGLIISITVTYSNTYNFRQIENENAGSIAIQEYLNATTLDGYQIVMEGILSGIFYAIPIYGFILILADIIKIPINLPELLEIFNSFYSYFLIKSLILSFLGGVIGIIISLLIIQYIIYKYKEFSKSVRWIYKFNLFSKCLAPDKLK